MQETSIHPKNIVNAAKNLPSTIPVSEMGAVRSSCSVRSFFSSAKSRIVKRGRRSTRTNIIKRKYDDVS